MSPPPDTIDDDPASLRAELERLRAEIRWFETHARVERDRDGRPTRIDASPDRAGGEHAAASLHDIHELADSLPALLWVRDATSEKLLYANEGWARVLGRPPAVGEDYRLLGATLHPEDRERVQASSPEALAGASDVVARFVDPDGDIRWYRVRGFVIRDANGVPLRIAGFAVDVTDVKAAEEKLRKSLREKEVLLREVHHRVKNNLQVISSLLHLQAAAADLPDLSARLMESQSRITSMALVHEMLYRSSDLSRIAIGPYARALVASLISTFGVNPDKVAIVVEAADVAVGTDIAVPCGLVLNEIVSNSLEHAFPGSSRGAIRIELGLAGDRCLLRASDDGVGLPADFEARRRSSLGNQLIEKLVEQIGGSMSRSSSQHGTRYEISFPVA